MIRNWIISNVEKLKKNSNNSLGQIWKGNFGLKTKRLQEEVEEIHGIKDKIVILMTCKGYYVEKKRIYPKTNN